MVKNVIIIFFILVRHGINPFKPVEKILDVMNKKLTNREKVFLISSCKNSILTKILYENLSFD